LLFEARRESESERVREKRQGGFSFWHWCLCSCLRNGKERKKEGNSISVSVLSGFTERLVSFEGRKKEKKRHAQVVLKSNPIIQATLMLRSACFHGL